jgi:hypothetical protein
MQSPIPPRIGPSPDRSWYLPAVQQIKDDVKHIHGRAFGIDPSRTYSLAALIDVTEAHNPETRPA